jgi:putative flippase GtrA
MMWQWVPLLMPSSTRTASVALFLRFGVVGLLNTAFGYAVFATLILLGLWPGAALVASTIAGVAFNFQTSRRLVFRSSGRFLIFVTLYGAVLTLNWAALRALHSGGLNDLLSQALLAPPLAAISFLGQRVFVFGSGSGPE